MGVGGMRRFILSLFFVYLFTVIKSNTIPKNDPLRKLSTETVIYGIVSEDVQNLQPINVTPPILSGDPNHEVCEYKLEPKVDSELTNASIPFRAILQDKKSGSALLIVGEGVKLDYETKTHYEFDLLTVYCDRSVPVARQLISVRVTDVNEFAPEWKEQGYLIEVAEGKLHDPLIKIEAVDKDGSKEFSSICSYKLVTSGVPFVLDNKGYLKNTKPLNYGERHNFILEVVAEDCGGLASEKVFVNILITQKCQAGWKGLRKSLNYELPSRGPSLLLDLNSASLQFCDLPDNCTVEQVSVSLKLIKTNTTPSLDENTVVTETESTCELDERSIERRLAVCESGLTMTDLLNSEVIGGNSTNRNEGLLFAGNAAYDVKTYKLVDDVYKDYLIRGDVEGDDGDTKLPDGRKKVETFVMTRDGPNSKFGISMWMRRSYEDAFPKEGKEEKQSILCSSDSEGMSRNHISLFLHNCHIVMLSRFEPSGRHAPDVLRRSKVRSGEDKSVNEDSEEVTMDTPERNEDDEFYRPSEWHWKLDQTCDDKWHHYAVNVEQGKARLFVDGNLFISTPRNPVTLEDHALHLSKKVHSTKLTVGACWKGLTQSYGDHFRGHLAELRVSRRSALKEATIKCVSNCNEKLDFHSINEMESGMSISMNSQMTELTINGRTKASVEHLLSTVGYTNPRMNMQLVRKGQLSSIITFQTNVKCADETYPQLMSKDSMQVHLVPSEVSPEVSHESSTLVSPKDDTKQATGSSLFISGTQRLDYSEKDIKRGVPVFRDVIVYHYPPERDLSYEELIKDNPHMKEIESCTIRVSPPMDEEVEDITHPHALAYNNHLRVDSSLEGLVVKGPSRAGDFVEVLKKTNYIHKRPEDLNKKIFVMFCHDFEGRKSKDDLVVELNAIHSEYVDYQPAGLVGQNKLLHPVLGGMSKGDGLQVEKFQEVGAKVDDKTGNTSVVATITVCICVLMVVISVGTYRVFFHRQKTVRVHVDNQQEPQWGRSTITITVNPLETTDLKEEELPEKDSNLELSPLKPSSDCYYDDDDDIGSAHEMMRDTEEEEDDDGGVERDGEDKKRGNNGYSDEDASKINHYVLSDTE